MKYRYQFVSNRSRPVSTTAPVVNPVYFTGTVRTTDGTVSDTQSKINAASDLDVIQLPLNGSFTWASAVTCSKALKIDLNGSTITRGSSPSAAIIQITVPANKKVRVTNGSFTSTSSVASYFEAIFVSIAGSATGYFRLDNLTIIDPQGECSFHTGAQKGLMDHCTFNTPDIATEILHINGYGNTSVTGWNYSFSEGTDDAVFIEDCDFVSTFTGGAGSTSAVQMYYGARTTFRYNTIDAMKFDCHGTAGQVGGRWWEVYENDWSTDQDLSQACQLRAGSGVCFNNTLTNLSGANGSRNLQMWEEDTGTYPLSYQIGRGTCSGGGCASDPQTGSDETGSPNICYFWNNTVVNGGGGTGGFTVDVNSATQAGLITLNVDYFLSAKGGYSPYTYPHPLQTSTD